MKIAVCGWYFNPNFIKTLEDSKYDWFFVCHKTPPEMEKDHFVVISNTGLEFGAYAWYVANKWNGENTLLIHDDVEIIKGALDEISKLTSDQCYLFSSEDEAKANGCVHGRAIFCSSKLMEKMKEDGMPWYDEGYKPLNVIPPTSADGPNYHNSGIQTFRAYLQSLPGDFKVMQIAIVPGLKLGYRGRI
jgi:hypothetical protein